MTVKPGHALRYEGAPFDNDGRLTSNGGTGGSGRAKCTCGALSPVLPSGRARKQWHREHKEQMR